MHSRQLMWRFGDQPGVLLLTSLACAPRAAQPLIPDYVSAAVTAVPDTVRASYALDPFYQKYADALGIPVVSSAKVPDAALLVARDRVLGRAPVQRQVRDARRIER